MENNLPRPSMTSENRQELFERLVNNLRQLSDGILNNPQYDDFVQHTTFTDQETGNLNLKLSLIFTSPKQVTVKEGELIQLDRITDSNNLENSYTLTTLDRGDKNLSYIIDPKNQSVKKLSYIPEGQKIRVLTPVITELNSMDDFATLTELILICVDQRTLIKPEKVQMAADINPKQESFVNNIKKLFRHNKAGN